MACVSIRECDRDVKGHLEFCKISGDIAVKNESRLLLARAGKQELPYYIMLCCNDQFTIFEGALGFAVLRCC